MDPEKSFLFCRIRIRIFLKDADRIPIPIRTFLSLFPQTQKTSLAVNSFLYRTYSIRQRQVPVPILISGLRQGDQSRA